MNYVCFVLQRKNNIVFPTIRFSLWNKSGIICDQMWIIVSTQQSKKWNEIQRRWRWTASSYLLRVGLYRWKVGRLQTRLVSWLSKTRRRQPLKNTSLNTVVLWQKGSTGSLPNRSALIILGGTNSFINCLFFCFYLHTSTSLGVVEKYDFINRERSSWLHSSQHARSSHNIRMA